MYGVGHHHPAVAKLLTLVDSDARWLQKSVIAVARGLNISAYHLQHLIRRDLGISYTVFVRKRRVALVRRIMREQPGMTIAEVGLMCGYEPTKLYRHFMAECAASPSEVRRQDALDSAS